MQCIHANPCQLTHYDITVHKLFQNAPYCTLPLTIRLVMEGIMCKRLTKRCNSIGSFCLFCLNKFIWYIEYIFIQCITSIINTLADTGQFIYSIFFFSTTTRFPLLTILISDIDTVTPNNNTDNQVGIEQQQQHSAIVPTYLLL